MDENKFNNSEETKSEEVKSESPKVSSDEKEKFSLTNFFSSKFIEYKSEFKRIIWPSRKVLAKQTFTVVVVSLIFGFMIFCMDTVFNLGVQLFAGLIG